MRPTHEIEKRVNRVSDNLHKWTEKSLWHAKVFLDV
jgi:hypothetical protein